MLKSWMIYLCFAFQLGFLGWLIFQNENVKQNGKAYRFLLTIPEKISDDNAEQYQNRLIFRDEKIAAKSFKTEWQQPFYIKLTEDNNGFAMPVSTSNNCKENGFLKVKQFGLQQDSLDYQIVNFRYSFDDFYLKEGNLQKANRALRKALANGKSIAWMEVRIKGCRAIPTGIFVDGKPLQYK
jgi:hypothetical protein